MRRRRFERIRQLTHGETAHKVFWIGIALKTLNAVLEVAGGIVLLTLSRQSIVNSVYIVFRHELIQDPNDIPANFLLHEAENLSAGMKLFAIVYLLTHGLIKLGLIGAIWRSKLWAYPAAGAVFSLFVAYQMYRFAYTHSIIMLLLTILDLIIIALLFPEYGRVKEGIAHRGGRA